MTLPSWWEVTTPHKDIREGRMTEAIFAANLGDVVYGKAPLEYSDASVFFQRTYLTAGLKTLLENVTSRLGSGKGDPVIQLLTPFGGGKTHALLTLYHMIKHRKEIAHLPVISEIPEVKGAKVAVFVGTYADVVSGKTPWGEIASQLGCYEIVKEHDRKRIAPGTERLGQILEKSGPTLILMDEVLEYIVKANRNEKLEKITQGQTLAFLQEITEVVASSGNCCLVLALPSSVLERYDEDAERSLEQLRKISARVEAIYSLVEGVELYEVIRRRLFEDYGDEGTRKKVAQGYFDIYQKLGSDVPSEVKEVAYRERIEHAYPFHPELIDVLYERWGSYPKFQRTRGVLRLLAEVVADLYGKKTVSPLIQSAMVNLENQTIRGELVKHIGYEFDAVISADIAGKNAKAPRMDREMGSEYEKYDIAKGIATSVFLHSFSAGASKETTQSRVRVAILREGIPAAIVGDAIARLEEELWYFHSERKQYAFRNQPNINRVIVDREEGVTDDKIREALKEAIDNGKGHVLEVYIWPERPSDIPDNKNLKLAILSPDLSYESGKTKKFANELFEKAGMGFRVYKNAIFALITDVNQYDSLCKALRRMVALSEIEGDKSMLETLTKESQEELKKKVKELGKEMLFRILTAYKYLAMLEEGGVAYKDLLMPTSGADKTISERVRRYLEDQEKLLTRVTAKYILSRTFGREENEKSFKEVYELCLKTPGMSIPASERVLLDAVAEGVRTGVLGVQEGTEIYYGQSITPTADTSVMRGEVAKKLKLGEAGKEEKVETKGVEVGKELGEKKKEGLVKTLTLRAKIPWDKVPHIITGVIRPLKEQGVLPEITIEIEARSDDGFDRTTLDSKVKETLRQIGAMIEEWKEE